MRMLIASIFIFLSGCASQSIPPPETIGIRDGKGALLTASLEWNTGGQKIVVPVGFYTDYASVPYPFKMILPDQGRYSRAAIIHDYLYWTQLCTRKQSDNLLLRGMREDGVNFAVGDAVYAGVRLGGWWAWKANKKERADGVIKVIPKDSLREAADKEDFSKYRKTISSTDAADKVVSGDPPQYCGLGDSVPTPVVTGEVPDPLM